MMSSPMSYQCEVDIIWSRHRLEIPFSLQVMSHSQALNTVGTPL